MKATAEQEKRVRLSLDVSQRFKDTLETISAHMDHGSLTETIRHAVYEYAKRNLPPNNQTQPRDHDAK